MDINRRDGESSSAIYDKIPASAALCMKTTAITILLACAFLGAGCSDSDQTATGPNPTLTPMPDYTQEEIAAMKGASPGKEGETRVQELQAVTAATSAPVRTIVGTEIVNTPTPTAAQPEP
jgi:hypothetical protein